MAAKKTIMKSTANFAKNFAKGEILVPHLNNWFANADFPDEIPISIHMNKEKDDAFHPSSALECLRVLQANQERLMLPRVTRMESQKNFAFGHFSHGLIQWVVVEALGFATWDDIEQEFDFDLVTPAGNPYRVRGFPDITRCVVPNKGTYLVDVKTMNARVYAQTNPGYDLINKYEAQVRLYLDFAGLDEGIILFSEKDTPHRFKERIVTRDDQQVDRIVKGWEKVVDARAAGEVAPCTCYEPDECPAREIYVNATDTKETEFETEDTTDTSDFSHHSDRS